MWKLLENIGLGLFVNATYSLLINLDMQLPVIMVLVLSISLMAISIYAQRRKL